MLYFDEDRRSFMVIVGYLENNGSVFFFIQVIFVFRA